MVEGKARSADPASFPWNAVKGKPMLPRDRRSKDTAKVLAIGALATGAFAVGAIALGAVAIRRLSVGRSTLKSLEIDQLTVNNLVMPADTRRRPSRMNRHTP